MSRWEAQLPSPISFCDFKGERVDGADIVVPGSRICAALRFALDDYLQQKASLDWRGFGARCFDLADAIVAAPHPDPLP